MSSVTVYSSAPTLFSSRRPISSIELQLSKPSGLGSLAAINLAAISEYFSGLFCLKASIAATPLAAKSASNARKKFSDSLSRRLGLEVFGLRVEKIISLIVPTDQLAKIAAALLQPVGPPITEQAMIDGNTLQ